MTGQGDIAPALPTRASPASPQPTIAVYLIGTFVGLIAVAVVATMFMTAEYRRGLIRTTLAASPRRGRVLAAKALVVGGGRVRGRAARRRRRGDRRHPPSALPRIPDFP